MSRVFAAIAAICLFAVAACSHKKCVCDDCKCCRCEKPCGDALSAEARIVIGKVKHVEVAENGAIRVKLEGEFLARRVAPEAAIFVNGNSFQSADLTRWFNDPDSTITVKLSYDGRIAGAYKAEFTKEKK